VRGEIRTRRWNDPALPDDGTRILVTRYRPRGVKRADETWSEWWKELGPSTELHAAAYGRDQPAIAFPTYRARYLEEMRKNPAHYIARGLAARIASGENVTLLCSSACTDEARCHRTVLRDLLQDIGVHS
jgi:uncharacterized protein YeaO (DUF488 family)